MQAISTQSLSSRPATGSLANRGKRSARQPGRLVIASAAKGQSDERSEQKGPNKVIMQAVGAIAAVQLALGGPAFAQDPLPQSAESQSARNEVNKETSDAPGLGAIGKNLTGNLFGGGGGGADAAKDAAGKAADKAKNAAPDLSDADPLPSSAESQSGRDAVNKETSDAPGLGSIGKNLFQSLGGGGAPSADDAKQATQQAANKAKNAAPDLSQGIFDRASKSLGSVGSEVDKNRGSVSEALTNIGKPSPAKKVSQTASKAAQTVSSKEPSAAKDVKGAAKGAASKTASKAKNAAPDLSQLPDPSELVNKLSGGADKAQSKASSAASQAQGKAQSFGSDVGAQASKAGSKAQNAGSNAAGKAQNAAPDLSSATGMPNPGDLLSKLQGRGEKFDALARQAPNKVQSFGSSVSGKASDASSKAQSAASKTAGKAKNAAPDLSFNPLDLIKGEASDAVDQTKDSAATLQSTGGQGFSSGGGPNPSTPEAKELAGGLKEGSKDLPVPDVGADVDTSGFKNLNKKPTEGTLSK